MADPTTYIQEGGVDGSVSSMIASIDSDNNSATCVFAIENDGGGVTHRQLEVAESGRVTVHGRIDRNGTHQINNASGASPLHFQSGGVRVALINGSGKGDFRTGGINLPVLTATPNGSKSGNLGDLILWWDAGSGKMRLMCCSGGTVWASAGH